MPNLKYKDTEIEYTLTRNAKRNVNFRIKNNGEVCISAPRYVNKKELEAMILERAEWILKNQSQVMQKKQNTMDSNIFNGSHIFIDGQKYYIKVSTGNSNSVHFRDNIIILQIKEKYRYSQEYLNTYFDKWLKEKMYLLSDQLMDQYLLKLEKYHLSKPELAIRTMTGR